MGWVVAAVCAALIIAWKLVDNWALGFYSGLVVLALNVWYWGFWRRHHRTT